MPPPEKKGGLALILGGGDKSEEPLDEKADAMKDLGEALKASDWSGAAMAFERAYELCSSSHEPDADDEEDVDDEELRY